MGLTDSKEILFGEGCVMHSRPEGENPNPRIWRKIFGFASGVIKKNAFRYPIFNLLIPIHDQDAIKQLRSGPFISISNKDYLEGRGDEFKQSLEVFLKEHDQGSYDQIWLQTLPRLFGYVFNPVSFWYCYSENTLKVVLCEVNNTFGERHFYLLKDSDENKNFSSHADKSFHVSPFFAVSGQYKFKFQIDEQSGFVSINLYESEKILLSTSVKLRFRPYREISQWYIFKKYGWMTPLVVMRIHWQALRLWIKGVNFYKKPTKPKEKVTYDINQSQ